MADRPGLKRKDLKKCACCDRGIMACGAAIFWRVNIEMFAVNMRAVERQHGLEMMLGSPALANVMGPDDDLAVRIETGDSDPMLVCNDCMLKHLGPAMVWREQLQKEG